MASLSGAGNVIRHVAGKTAPQWSLGGERILYNEKDVGLRIIDRDGGNDRALLAESEGEDLLSGDWNSAGILYVRIDKATTSRDIWRIDPDGTKNRQITSGPANDRRPHWGFGEMPTAVENWLLFK